jgi:hypothetical protein
MPYKSAKQRSYMHIHLPDIATKWDHKYGGKVVPTKPKPAPKKKAK